MSVLPRCHACWEGGSHQGGADREGGGRIGSTGGREGGKRGEGESGRGRERGEGEGGGRESAEEGEGGRGRERERGGRDGRDDELLARLGKLSKAKIFNPIDIRFNVYPNVTGTPSIVPCNQGKDITQKCRGV
jgi:hypothetical protein